MSLKRYFEGVRRRRWKLKMNVHDASSGIDGYEGRRPGPQNALDIFAGDWTSQLPLPEAQGLVAGTVPLFADHRIAWAIAALGGVANLRILELGPLEGGHSWMLTRAGAGSVLAIEGNRRAYLRCLILKELLGIERVRFECGDFTSYLRDTGEEFDVVFASGVLYHQLNPLQLLSDIARVSPALFLWTHYYDADLIGENAALAGKLGPLEQTEFDGRRFFQSQYKYLEALKWSGFCGGAHLYSYWLPKAEILAALALLGYNKVQVAFEQPDHPNGPCFALVATK